MFQWKKYLLFTVGLCLTVLLCAGTLSGVTTVLTPGEPVILIDPGHGGEDGGALTPSGVRESQINLEIALRLRDFLGLMGVRTVMTRTEDVSIYKEGETFAQKKVSDLRERVRLTQTRPGCTLLSIHQNFFDEPQYRGAQIFYAPTPGSETLAHALREALRCHLDPKNHRECKEARDIYLMEHISCRGVLIECGFLSNPEEARLLQEEVYQKKLAAVIGCCAAAHFGENYEI